MCPIVAISVAVFDCTAWYIPSPHLISSFLIVYQIRPKFATPEAGEPLPQRSLKALTQCHAFQPLLHSKWWSELSCRQGMSIKSLCRYALTRLVLLSKLQQRG